MSAYWEFLFDHQTELIIFFVLWNGLIIAASIIYRKRKDAEQVPFDETKLEFYDGWASGSSHKNIVTRFGGASNCLKVSVNKKEVYIRPQFIFRFGFIPEFLDLEHRFDRNQLISIKKKSGLLGKSYILMTYSDSTGYYRTFKLYLDNEEQFVSVLQGVHANTA